MQPTVLQNSCDQQQRSGQMTCSTQILPGFQLTNILDGSHHFFWTHVYIFFYWYSDVEYSLTYAIMRAYLASQIFTGLEFEGKY